MQHAGNLDVVVELIAVIGTPRLWADVLVERDPPATGTSSLRASSTTFKGISVLDYYLRRIRARPDVDGDGLPIFAERDGRDQTGLTW